MNAYIGIDLGTSNTVVATNNGSTTSIVKSYGHSDSTPSAVLIQPDGTIRAGRFAIKDGQRFPHDLFTRFKRLLGTNATFTFPSANVVRTPIWASSELLRYVFGLVPADVRNDENRITVVTVPAAFGYQQNLATKEAAAQAGLGQIELLAEPIAAALSIVKNTRADKTVLVYDMGGGTFDVSLVKIEDGTPSIIAQGGISHLGGTNWDNDVLGSCVQPWLVANKIDDDSVNDPTVHRILTNAIEEAKISLSEQRAADPYFNQDVKISVFEDEHPLRLPNGSKFDITVPVGFLDFDNVAELSIATSIEMCQDVLNEHNLFSSDIDGIAFIGGPSLWPTLRKRVTDALHIFELPGINPLTAVAEGAAIYAQSKKAGEVSKQATVVRQTSDFPLSLTYNKVVSVRRPIVQVTLDVSKYQNVEFSIDGAGFSTGRLPLQFSRDVAIELMNDGDTTFTVTAFPPDNALPVMQSFTITKVIGIGSVPANATTFIRAVSADGTEFEAINIIKRGQPLPIEGSFKVRLTKDLKNESDVAEFKVFQGEITDEINDNSYVGALILSGKQLNGKTLTKGAELVCKYQLGHGLDLTLDVVIPDIEHTVKNLFFDLHDGFDPALGWVDLISEAKDLRQRILDYLRTKGQDPRLSAQLPVLVGAIRVLEESNIDSEITKAHSDIQTVRNIFFLSRAENVPAELKRELKSAKTFFETGHDGKVKEALKSNESVDIEKWYEEGVAAADAGDVEKVARLLEKLDQLKWKVLWRCDWWIVLWLKKYLTMSGPADLATQAQLGLDAMEADEFDMASSQLSKCIRMKRAHDASNAVNRGPLDDIQISS